VPPPTTPTLPEDITSALAALATAFPDNCELITLPNKSADPPGVEITCVRLHEGTVLKDPAVLVIGGVHGREMVPPDALLRLAQDLLAAYKNVADITFPPLTAQVNLPKPAPPLAIDYPAYRIPADHVQKIIKSVDVYILPCVNPDGRQWDILTPAIPFPQGWRKNRRPNPDNKSDKAVGVDINRNFDVAWDFGRYFDMFSYWSKFDRGPASAWAERDTFNGVSDPSRTVTVAGGPTGGSFILSFGGADTGSIPFNAPASVIQDQLTALTTIKAGNITVTGPDGGPYSVTFTGTLAHPIPMLTASHSSLTGGNNPRVHIYQDGPADPSRTVTIKGDPTGGSFTLSFGGADTASIPFNAPASVIQDRLTALSTIGAGNITVTGPDDRAFLVTFTGALAPPNALLTVSSSLTGGSNPDVEIEQDGPADPSRTVTITGDPTAGSFTLSFGGADTAPIPFDAGRSAIEDQLAALPTIGPGNVAVNGLYDRAFLVTFTGALAQPTALLTASYPGLTGGSNPRVQIQHAGPTAEPETLNVQWLVDNRKIRFFLDVHSAGRTILVPWALEDNGNDPSMSFRQQVWDWQRDGLPPADILPPHTNYNEYVPNDFPYHLGNKLNEIAGAMRTAILRASGADPAAALGTDDRKDHSAYAVGFSSRYYLPHGGGPNTGGSDDYAFSRQFVDTSRAPIYAFTMEVGGDEEGLFHPDYTAPANQYQKIEREVYAAADAFLMAAANWGRWCLIATAAYGSEAHPDVVFLRTLRDDELRSTRLGRRVVAALERIYYTFSPATARYLIGRPRVSRLVRTAVVHPVVVLLWSLARASAPIRPHGLRIGALAVAIVVLIAIVTVSAAACIAVAAVALSRM
jgi:hypothetical protein